MTQIIGLLGPAGSGKSTAAQYLERKLGAKRYALADPLKKIVRRAFDLSFPQLYGSQKEKETIDPRYNLSPRQLMQMIGEAQRSVFGEDVWVDHILDRIMDEDQPNFAVVEDVRYVNEASRLRENGAIILKLNRPDRPTSTDASHSSENQWDLAPFDCIVNNDKDTLKLYTQLDEVCRIYDWT